MALIRIPELDEDDRREIIDLLVDLAGTAAGLFVGCLIFNLAYRLVMPKDKK